MIDPRGATRAGDEYDVDDVICEINFGGDVTPGTIKLGDRAPAREDVRRIESQGDGGLYRCARSGRRFNLSCNRPQRKRPTFGGLVGGGSRPAHIEGWKPVHDPERFLHPPLCRFARGVCNDPTSSLTGSAPKSGHPQSGCRYQANHAVGFGKVLSKAERRAVLAALHPDSEDFHLPSSGGRKQRLVAGCQRQTPANSELEVSRVAKAQVFLSS